MNVARGRSAFSLLQRGFGARAGAVSTGDFLGGFNLNPPLFKKRQEDSSSFALTMSNADCCRRLLNTRVGTLGSINVRMMSTEAKQPTPTLAIAKEMPLSCKEMNNSDLVMLGSMGNIDARAEILIRHIMTVDGVEWEEAHQVFNEISEQNRQGMWILTLPYKIGMGIAVSTALISFPMVFEINTVSWFNEYYVTADVPEPKDLETPLEVGSWAWAWMEPALGWASFFLLCMQYTRAQIENIGIRPYTEKIQAMRAENLAKSYPQYNPKVIMDFSLAVEFYDDNHGIKSGK